MPSYGSFEFDPPSKPHSSANRRDGTSASAKKTPSAMETANPYGSSREHFVPFRVAATVVELNQDTSPGIEFPGRTSQISRSSICIFTRRMVYESTSLLIILPLLDDRPCVLGGLVSKCEYDAAGEYRIVVDFSRHCRSRLVEAWVKQNNYAWWQDRNGGDDHDTDAQSSSRAAG